MGPCRSPLRGASMRRFRGVPESVQAVMVRGDRRHAVDAEGDDLLLHLDEQPAERLVIAQAFLGVEAGQQRVTSQVADKGIDPLS